MSIPGYRPLMRKNGKWLAVLDLTERFFSGGVCPTELPVKKVPDEIFAKSWPTGRRFYALRGKSGNRFYQLHTTMTQPIYQ